MLLNSDINLCKCANPPTALDTASVGGAISSGPTFITGSVSGEMNIPIDPDDIGGSSITLTTKVFWQNQSTTDTAKSCSIYFENFIDDAPSLNTVTLQSSSALDTSAFFARVIGFNNSGTPIQADINLNGVTAVTTTATFLHISRVEIRANSNGALVAAYGDITVKSGSTTLGIIPNGLRTASTEWSVLMDGALNSTTTIANPQSSPAGTFFSPRTEATALSFAADLSHVAGPNAQGCWPRIVIPPGTLGSEAYDESFVFLCKV